MSKKVIPYLELLSELNFLIDTNTPYTYERQGNSVILTPIGGHSYFATRLGFNSTKEKALPKDQIYFIEKVANYIESNNLHKKIKPNYKSTDEIKYWDYNKDIKPGTTFKKAFSVDVSKAYFKAAKIAGWINNELYAEGINLDKRIRLASLGTFAKHIDIWKYNGKVEKHIKSIKPKYPHVFFNQANTISKIMQECKGAIGDQFLLSWCDGIYFKDEFSATICEKIIFNYGFGSKTTKLNQIKRTEKAFISMEKGEENKKYSIAYKQ